MTPSYYTKKTFEKIKSSKKKYSSFNGAHFPTDKLIYVKWAHEVELFLQPLNYKV